MFDDNQAETDRQRALFAWRRVRHGRPKWGALDKLEVGHAESQLRHLRPWFESAERARPGETPTARMRSVLERVYWLLRTLEPPPPMGSRAEFRAALDAAERLLGTALELGTPPRRIRGATVILFSPIDGRHRPTGWCRRPDTGVARGLAICQREGETGFRLFACGVGWEYQAESPHPTVEAAQAQAESECAGVSATWQRPDGPRRDA